MKLLLILLGLSQTFSIGWCQASKFSSLQIQTKEDFSKLLLATTWSWERTGITGEEINFFPGEVAQHTAFRAGFKVKNPHEVELNWKGRTAQLVFDANYAGYTGTDFDGKTVIHGQRKNEPSLGFMRPSASIPTAQINSALLGKAWAFEAPKISYRERRKFSSNGSWKAVNSALHGTWRIEGNRVLVTLTSNPSSPEVFYLPPRIFDSAAGKIRLEGTGSNGDAVNMEAVDPSSSDPEPVSPDPAYFGKTHP